MPMTDRHECLTEDIITTPAAAERLGKSVATFLSWAHKRGIRPVERIRIGRSTHLVWSKTEILNPPNPRRTHP